MKNPLVSLPHFFVGLAGCIAVSQAISFGWYSEGAIVGSVLRNHAVILFVAGIGLLAAGYFMRQSSSRISALEQQLALLQQKKS
jgi:hypothetical protein